MAKHLDWSKAKRDQERAAARARQMSGPFHLPKPPTERQLDKLRSLGVEAIPDDIAMASRWIKVALKNERQANPTPKPAKRSRAAGTNPRAIGANPRALGTNPRAVRQPET